MQSESKFDRTGFQMPTERPFEELFQTSDPRRDKFLSRLFGLFSEDVVRYWAMAREAPYEDLGRPTLFREGVPRWHTLDFMLREKRTGCVFVSELKCELEFEGYRYLRLANPRQLEHHRGAAFQKFLQMARDPSSFEVRVVGKPVQANGAVLVWGALTSEGRKAAMEEYGFADVLSVEEMLRDLREWEPPHWRQRVGEVRRWSQELFDGLL
jgi:hypothetical protein